MTRKSGKKTYTFSCDCVFWTVPLRKNGTVDKRFRIFKDMESWFKKNGKYIHPSSSITFKSL